jgi:hypothetical protein
MSLNWDITSIENHEELCYEDAIDADGNPEINPETEKPFVRLKPLTEALIFATMYLDLGEITEDNYEEFWWRSQLYAVTTGNHMLLRRTTDDDGNATTEGHDPTLEEIHQHIGLRCNVTDTTTAKFMAKLRTIWQREAASRKARREYKAAKNAA